MIDFIPVRETRFARPAVRSQCEPHAALPPSTPSNDSQLKRVFDIVAAALGLVLTAPLLFLLAALVKLDSRGPAIYSQVRVGQFGRTFRMYKLRTMHDGAHEDKDTVAHLNRSDDARLFKIPLDPRVTRIGRLIRRWSLDEIPQLYNVLCGEMSLVGPRPFFVEDLALYEPHHMHRLLVKPGLTGLWQVSGRSDIVDFEEVVRLDHSYIESWSFGLDLRILGRTFSAIMGRRGAY